MSEPSEPSNPNPINDPMEDFIQNELPTLQVGAKKSSKKKAPKSESVEDEVAAYFDGLEEKERPVKKGAKKMTLGDAINDKAVNETKKMRDAVDKTAQHIGKAISKAAREKMPEDTPQLRRDLMTKISQYRDRPLYCTPIVKNISIDSPLKKLLDEVASCEEELSHRRGARFLYDAPSTIMSVVETVEKVAGPYIPAFKYIGPQHGLKQYWEQKVSQDEEIQLIMAELSVKHGGWFRTSPELAMVMCMGKVIRENGVRNLTHAQSSINPNADQHLDEFDDL